MSDPRATGSGGAHAPLAIVLHTHMPYVLGYGTWPYGEEWLWEVYATSYLPVARLIAGGAPLTLSLTPVLADQLAAPQAREALRRFLDEDRRRTHAEDQAGLRRAELSGELAASEHSWEPYADALAHLEATDAPLLAPLAQVARWTSSATHAVLPLLATDAGLRLQLDTGIAGHRHHCGDWAGGLWLPECAWDPAIQAALVDAGVHATCVEVTDPQAASRGPWRTEAGLTILPIDRPLIDAVWHHEGYPAAGAYRSSHARSYQGHALWNNEGAPYDARAGAALAREHAVDWAGRCAAALADGVPRIVAFDTELFGHWWHEGPAFLAAAVHELARLGVPLVTADELAAAADLPVAPPPAPSTWGAGRDLRTWSAPAVAEIAWGLRDAELAVLTGPARAPQESERLRGLLALQSSDWAFMVTEERAAEYGLARYRAHYEATCGAAPVPSDDPRPTYLAPALDASALAAG